MEEAGKREEKFNGYYNRRSRMQALEKHLRGERPIRVQVLAESEEILLGSYIQGARKVWEKGKKR